MSRRIDITADLLKVAQAWSSEDDWGVPTIHMATLRDLAAALEAGDDAGMLQRHGKHVAATCLTVGCVERIPAFMEKEREDRQRMQRRLNERAEARHGADETRARDIEAAEATL